MLAFLPIACEQATLQGAETVFVDYLEAKALVDGDSVWKSALTTSRLTFFDNGENCMYAAGISGCLPYLDNLPAY
jgi:hypothetical protein